MLYGLRFSHISVNSHLVWSAGRNEPLKKDKPKWKSDYPMTEGQLRSKRDEFWDTAPAFEGRKEIWDALKAAAVALECNDQELAQAIVDGANITLPHGESLRSDVTKPALCVWLAVFWGTGNINVLRKTEVTIFFWKSWSRHFNLLSVSSTFGA